ncbi:hypothetical protein [Oenococcus oeni]|uniref:hypothetical protein n=1 Tax=Oenococcus oeni TaxID=1247 RepID=UPI000B1009F5|nr:hypothetical protein [Oenococcus oeni]
MLYVQTGIVTNRLQARHAADDWQELLAIKSQQAPEIDSAVTAKAYKRDKATFVIAGTMTKAIRQNANLVSRSILFFDIDNTNGDDYPTAVAKIQTAFKAMAYLIYPTISNGYKGTRLRVAIPIDQPFNAQQRSQLGTYLAQLLPDDWGNRLDQLSL